MNRILTVLLLLFCASASAVTTNRITARVTFTAGTSDGQTLVVNGTTRTFKTTVTVSSTQILLDATAAGSKTNAYNQIGLNPFASTVILDASSTAFDLVGSAGVNLTVTVGAYGTVTYTTQAVATAVGVRIPTSVEVAAQQTNINSGLLAAIRDNSDTNVLYESTPAMVNFAGLTNNQTVTGKKTWTGSNFFNSVYLSSPFLTNGVNYGNAFSSAGSANFSEQFGGSASASGISSLAVGNSASADGLLGTAVGKSSVAHAGATAVGANSGATNANDSAFGKGAVAAGTNSTAIGANTTVSATHSNSTVIGYNATSTAANQIMLGGSGINAVVQNALSVGAGVTAVNGYTNAWFTGTNTFPASSDIGFGRYALTSLATGNNAAIPIGTNVFVEVSGPGAAFTINGINGSPNRDGKFLIILNQTGFNMTVAHESGTDPTAANRIVTMTGADRATTGNGAALLIYSGAASRWILLNLDP